MIQYKTKYLKTQNSNAQKVKLKIQKKFICCLYRLSEPCYRQEVEEINKFSIK